MLETKTVTGTWLVEEITHLYDLTIAEGAALKGPVMQSSPASP